MKKFLIRNTLYLILFIFLYSCSPKNSVENHAKNVDYADERGYFRIVSYNTENFYDPFNDSLTNDDDFTPEGSYHWTWDKFKEKQRKVYKVIAAVGGWELPDIMGFAEIENHFVMENLLNSTPLKWRDYGLVHKESPDKRGIDVALIYRKEKFRLLHQGFYKIQYPWDTTLTTRDIIYVKGVTNFNDTLHVFMNHWPSKYGGQTETDRNRKFVAGVLRSIVDSIFKTDKASNIIIMGDFNDEPDNDNLFSALKVKNEFDTIQYGKLYNLGWYMKNVKGMGSLKFQGKWGLIDQFIISGSLLMKSNSIYTTPDNAHVFNADFLSEKDETFIGSKPFRTSIGFKYNGGFSDHYPIYLDFFKK
jgi:predicted extracellular nuclease